MLCSLTFFRARLIEVEGKDLQLIPLTADNR